MALQLQFNPLVLPLGFSVMLILALIVLGWRQRQSALAVPFIAMMICAFIWIGFSLLEIITLNLELSLVAADLSFLGISFLGVTWLSIVLIYTGKQRLLRRILPWVLVIPILTNLIIWTNPMHNLWRGESYRDLTLTWFPVSFYEYGPWFYAIHVPYSLTLAFIIITLFVTTPLRKENVYGRQVITMLVAFCLPLIFAVLDLIGVAPIPYFNISSFAFAISGLVAAWGIFDFDILDLTPIARDLVVEHMREQMIVLDDQQRVIDTNPAAREHIFCCKEAFTGKRIDEVMPLPPKVLAQLQQHTHSHEEMTIMKEDGERIYEVFVSPITRQQNIHQGSLLLLRDITERKMAQQSANEQMQRMAIIEERQRVARDLHDSVNQTIFAASTLADLLPRAIERKPEKVAEYATNIQQLTHGATAEMRLVLLELYPDALTDTDLGTLLKHLCQAFTGVTGIPVTTNLSAQVILDSDAHTACYRIAQEALNNISKHANASTVTVTLSQVGRCVTLSITDDGQGFDVAQTPSDHFGLQNMHTRAADAGLTLDITSHIEIGTTVKLVKEIS